MNSRHSQFSALQSSRAKRHGGAAVTECALTIAVLVVVGAAALQMLGYGIHESIFEADRQISLAGGGSDSTNINNTTGEHPCPGKGTKVGTNIFFCEHEGVKSDS
jgi:hypothetical protein